MTSATRRFAIKVVSVVLIVALLDAIGVPPLLMIFITGIFLIVWIVTRRSLTREVEGVFDFYVAAEAILRDEERRWYGFEISEVIDSGELALETMPDSPPLHLFALGALHHRMGNHAAADEYLSRLVEDESNDEIKRRQPSPQLRRYVSMLRKIEDNPEIAPQALGAVRNLERARRKHAGAMLAESRNHLQSEVKTPAIPTPPTEPQARPACEPVPAPVSFATLPPPPISEVLHDVYQDEQGTSH